jgi:MFS family permease
MSDFTPPGRAGGPGQAAPGLGRRRRLLVLAICCASILVVVMDISIVNVALPAIRRDLHASVSGLQWTVDAYTLVLASFLVLAGSAADRFGRRRLFLAGLAAFGSTGRRARGTAARAAALFEGVDRGPVTGPGGARIEKRRSPSRT